MYTNHCFNIKSTHSSKDPLKHTGLTQQMNESGMAVESATTLKPIPTESMCKGLHRHSNENKGPNNYIYTIKLL